MSGDGFGLNADIHDGCKRFRIRAKRKPREQRARHRPKELNDGHKHRERRAMSRQQGRHDELRSGWELRAQSERDGPQGQPSGKPI